MRRPTSRSATCAATLALALPLLLAGAGDALADPWPPLEADHAYIGDPLFGPGLAGTLYGIMPDARTSMAETAMVMTLHLAAEAITSGAASLEDDVVISATAVGAGGFDFVDVNQVGLEVGEVIKLKHLLRAMMWKRGKVASWAVAEHIAGKLGDPPNINNFVGRMNDHALADGLVDTSFATPDGADHVRTYTTARELSRLFVHAYDQHQVFRDIIAPLSDYSEPGCLVFSTIGCISTTLGATQKFYLLSNSGGYWGSQGGMVGSSPLCKGFGTECVVATATRLGRRVVASAMQASYSDLISMLGYGFSLVFDPKARGESGPLATTTTIFDAAVSCLPNGKALTASLLDNDAVRLATWQANLTTSTITLQNQTPLPISVTLPPASREIQLARLTDQSFVVATRHGTAIKLRQYSLPTLTSVPQVVGVVAAATGNTFSLVRLGDARVALLVVGTTGALTTSVWTVPSGGGMAQLTSTTNTDTTWGEVAAASSGIADANGNLHFVAIARSAATNNGASFAFQYSRSGGNTVTQQVKRNLGLGAIRPGSLAATSFSVAALPGEGVAPSYYALGMVLQAYDSVRFTYERITSIGTPVFSGDSGDTYTTGAELSLAPFANGGVVSAVRTTAGTETITVWDMFRNSDETITRLMTATRDEAAASQRSSLGVCVLPGTTAAEADVLVSSRLASKIAVQGWRLGQRP